MLAGFRKYSAGFTMVELIIVVVILGILAGIAIPGYRKTVEKGFGDEAKVVLQAIYTAERSYRLHHNTYSSSLANLTAYIENPNTTGAKFVYSISSVAATTFQARATRNSKYLAINQDGPVDPGHWTWPY